MSNEIESTDGLTDATDGLLERRLISMIDADGGDNIEMEVFLELDMEGKTYALLTPAEAVVSLLKVVPGETDDDETLEEVEPKEFATIRKHINGELRQWKCALEVHVDEFILTGEPPEEFYDECETLETETEEGEQEFLVPIEIDTGDAVYLVAIPAEPAMYPVEIISENEARALDDKELGRMEETFREALNSFADDDEE